MNMISGAVEKGDFVALDGTRIPLDGKLLHLSGQAVTLGVRPEHFVLDPEGVAAQVLTVEPTGSETQVVARFAGSDITGAFRERVTTRPGGTLKMRPDLGMIHLFETATGKRIAQ